MFTDLVILFLTFSLVYSDGQSPSDQDIFLEKPKKTAVYESETASFKCAVKDSSFIIIWLVNDTSAAFDINKNKGISIVPESSTASRLDVIGYMQNNNTNVSCAVLKYQNDPPLDVWIPGDPVLLTVMENQPRNLKEITETTAGPPSTESWRNDAKEVNGILHIILPLAVGLVLFYYS